MLTADILPIKLFLGKDHLVFSAIAISMLYYKNWIGLCAFAFPFFLWDSAPLFTWGVFNQRHFLALLDEKAKDNKYQAIISTHMEMVPCMQVRKKIACSIDCDLRQSSFRHQHPSRSNRKLPSSLIHAGIHYSLLGNGVTGCLGCLQSLNLLLMWDGIHWVANTKTPFVNSRGSIKGIWQQMTMVQQQQLSVCVHACVWMSTRGQQVHKM